MFTKAILAVIGSLIATTSVLSADTPPDAIQFQMGDGTVVMLLNKVGDDNWVADIAGHKDFAFDPADTPPYTTEAMSVTFLAPPDTRPISSSEGALAPVAPSVVVSVSSRLRQTNGVPDSL